MSISVLLVLAVRSIDDRLIDAIEELSPLGGQLGDASELLQGHAPVLLSLHLYVHLIHQPLPVLREMVPGPNN